MSVLIKGMEMPKNCFECPWRCKVDPENLLCRISGEYFEETFSGTIQNRHKSCPLVPVQPHGRLIDADALYEDCALDNRYEVEATATRINEYMQIKIDDAPTVIPADPSEAQREYEASVEQVQYCELHEPTYDPETGAL